MMKTGYKMSFSGRLITIFSARNYVNTGNAAAVIRLLENVNFFIIKLS